MKRHFRYIITVYMLIVIAAKASQSPIIIDESATFYQNGGDLLLEFRESTRKMSDGIKIATIVVVVPPQSKIPGQEMLESGDEIFAVDGLYFRSTTSMARYIGSKHPGDNVRLDYFSHRRFGNAVSAIFPVGSEDGFPSENAIHYERALDLAIKICSKLNCLGDKTKWIPVIGIGIELLSPN